MKQSSRSLILRVLVSGIVVGTAVAPGIASAQERADEIGHSTRAWLALQADGSAAAPAQPMPGAQAGAAYDRYMKSFGTAIPERFTSSFVDGGKPTLNVEYQNAGGAQN